MGMASQSSLETRNRSRELAKAIGSDHRDIDIDDVFHAQKGLLTRATGHETRFKVHGGTNADNLASFSIAKSRSIY